MCVFSLPLSLQPNVVYALWAIITNYRWVSSHKKNELYWQLITISETKEHNSTNSYRFRFTIMLFFVVVWSILSGLSNFFKAEIPFTLSWSGFLFLHLTYHKYLLCGFQMSLVYLTFYFVFGLQFYYTLYLDRMDQSGKKWKLTEYIWTEYS